MAALIQVTAMVGTNASGTIVNRAIVWDSQGDGNGSDRFEHLRDARCGDLDFGGPKNRPGVLTA